MRYGKTGCGLQYAVRKSGSAAAYCALSIKCGTRDEEGFHSGIAHFTEHAIFKGAGKKSASVINSYIDKLGGELNAFTTKEEIVLHATVLKEDLPKAANLLFELATSPVFPEAEVDIEKGVIMDEINSYKDSPSEDIYDKFEEMIFEGHPLSRPILGTMASVKKIGGRELSEFVREKFTPDRMAFTIVADMDEGRMEKFVGRMADKWLRGNDIGRNPADNGGQDGGIPASSGTKHFPGAPYARKFDKTVSKKNHQVNCVIGSLGPSLYEGKERIATILLCNILGGPASNSILNYELREKNGWVYGVECTYTQYSDTGIVTICLGCDKENMERCLKAISRETDRLKSGLLSDRKLAAAKKQFLGQMAISSDNGETQCIAMGKSLLAYGMLLSDEDARARIEAVTAEDIRSAACRVFDEASLCRLTYI